MLSRNIKLQTPEKEPIDAALIEAPQETASTASPVAPAWHTVALLAGILALSIHGASQISVIHGPVSRLRTYGFTAAIELALLGWVALGLRFRKIPVRSLFGAVSGGIRSIVRDIGVALVFWIGALMVLGTLGIFWSGVEAALEHRPPATRSAQPFAPDPSQRQAARALAQLAPANGEEIAAWALLCVLAGIVEELVFRGYLQRQFTAWAHGAPAAGVAFSALAFGAAHGYQGMRNMALLAVFGVLLSLLALNRRSLRAGMIAHSWHDLIAGLALALLRSRHVL
jgi:membrane protease YdiL (CAAX protease family)